MIARRLERAAPQPQRMIGEARLLTENVAVQDRRRTGEIIVFKSDAGMQQFRQGTRLLACKPRFDTGNEILRWQLAITSHFTQSL